MKTKMIFIFLSSSMTLQSCSLLNQSHCNNQQVLTSVQQLYAKQVNNNPLEKLGQLSQRFNTNSPQIQESAIENIKITQIKHLKIEDLKTDQSPEAQNILSLIKDRFEGAESICQAVIQQEINTSKLTEIAQQLAPEESTLIQGHTLNIPIVYAVYPNENNKNFEVQYSPQNSLHLMLAMMLKK